MPRFTREQQVTTDLDEFEMINKKVYKVCNRRYIAGGTVLSLISFFNVTKGDDDIRLVYDITALGMKDSLWDPIFWIPLVQCT